MPRPEALVEGQSGEGEQKGEQGGGRRGKTGDPFLSRFIIVNKRFHSALPEMQDCDLNKHVGSRTYQTTMNHIIDEET
jgi:hypothetical protein